MEVYPHVNPVEHAKDMVDYWVEAQQHAEQALQVANEQLNVWGDRLTNELNKPLLWVRIFDYQISPSISLNMVV